MAGLLRIILIIIVAYYLVRFLDRHVVPFLFGTGKKDSEDKVSDPHKNNRKKRVNDDVGEYTDFEEME